MKIVTVGSDAERNEALALLNAVDLQSQSAVVLQYEKTPPSEDVVDLLHDFNGALRSFKYLAEKVKSTYAQDDERGQRMMASIDRHVEQLENIKARFIDRLFESLI